MSKKISIIGTGAVGSTLAFHILSRLNLKELVLVDINPGIAKGMALDLEDTRGFLEFTTDIKAGDDFSLISDSDIIVFTAGIPRKDGMTRQDLLNINGKIAKDTSALIKKYAPKSIVIAVTNPLDVITSIFLKETGFPRERVMGMGASLDTSRLLNLLFKKTGISTSSIEGYVWGLHNNDMMASPDRIKIKGAGLEKFMTPDESKELISRVKLRGGEIVSFLKNKSAYFAPSLACYFLVESIINDKNKVIPVSVFLNGEYGLNDVCAAAPCVINKNGASKIIQFDLTEQEKKELQKISDFFKNQ
jgi:malate dehydrogenase